MFLIKTSVLKTLEPFNQVQTDSSGPPVFVTLGVSVPDHWCDDTDFFRRCTDLGIEIWGDLSVVVGHMSQMTVWPRYENGQWMTIYDVGSKDNLKFGTLRPIEPVVEEAVTK